MRGLCKYVCISESIELVRLTRHLFGKTLKRVGAEGSVAGQYTLRSWDRNFWTQQQ
jgi:hypothetical protein